jgi:CBS domain containing-hemolysin-like protein
VRSPLRTAFPEVPVREVIVPRFKIQALPLDSTPDAILGYLLAHHSSRYPVYGQSLDDIHGILYLKDVFDALARHELLDLARLMRPALMVPETLPVGCLFERFQRERVQMAVVANEYGTLCGVVTLEDLIEQIVGAIADEFDEEDVMIERLDDQALLVDGAFFVRDLNRLCGFAIPESTVYATLGGFLLTLFQHLPREGEVVAHGEYTYTIVRMDGRRVAKARAARMTQDGDGEAKVE